MQSKNGETFGNTVLDLRVKTNSNGHGGPTGIGTIDLMTTQIYCFEQMVVEIGNLYNIDRTRVMAVGHSRGGAMSVIAALELPHVFSGAVPQAGFTEFSYDVRMRAYEGRVVPMYFIHGAADPDVSVMASDNMVGILESIGWGEEDLHYDRIDGVKHRWQPQLNQHWYEFLAARPLPEEVLQ